MACKYLIKLRSGEIIEIPTSLENNDQYTSQNLRDSLHELPKEKLSEIIDLINASENVPLDVRSLNLKNVSKTGTLGNIKYFNSNHLNQNLHSYDLFQVIYQNHHLIFHSIKLVI